MFIITVAESPPHSPRSNWHVFHILRVCEQAGEWTTDPFTIVIFYAKQICKLLWMCVSGRRFWQIICCAPELLGHFMKMSKNEFLKRTVSDLLSSKFTAYCSDLIYRCGSISKQKSRAIFFSTKYWFHNYQQSYNWYFVIPALERKTITESFLSYLTSLDLKWSV